MYGTDNLSGLNTRAAVRTIAGVSGVNLSETLSIDITRQKRLEYARIDKQEVLINYLCTIGAMSR
jgi:hypothetical protein